MVSEDEIDKACSTVSVARTGAETHNKERLNNVVGLPTRAYVNRTADTMRVAVHRYASIFEVVPAFDNNYLAAIEILLNDSRVIALTIRPTHIQTPTNRHY